jgi:hypothetical protein
VGGVGAECGGCGAGLGDNGVDERGGGAAEVPVAHADDGAHPQAHARAVLHAQPQRDEEEEARQGEVRRVTMEIEEEERTVRARTRVDAGPCSSKSFLTASMNSQNTNMT